MIYKSLKNHQIIQEAEDNSSIFISELLFTVTLKNDENTKRTFAGHDLILSECRLKIR